MAVVPSVPAAGRRSALLLRPWLAADMPALVAEMNRECPAWVLWPGHTGRPDRCRWTGPRDEQEAAEWLASQDRGWRDGDWLTFAVLEQEQAAGAYRLAGHIGLKGGEPGDRVGRADAAEVGYWTAVGARGRGVATAALQAVTSWAFDTFSGGGLRQIKVGPPSWKAFTRRCPAAPAGFLTGRRVEQIRPVRTIKKI